MHFLEELGWSNGGLRRGSFHLFLNGFSDGCGLDWFFDWSGLDWFFGWSCLSGFLSRGCLSWFLGRGYLSRGFLYDWNRSIILSCFLSRSINQGDLVKDPLQNTRGSH